MITEDYVSFETAKLLKENGFDEYGMYFYTLKDEGREGYKSNDMIEEFAHNSHPELKERAVSCPTLQMAMKWLREVHNIVIVITPSMFWGKYNVNIYKINNEYPFGFDGDSLISSYEEACEAAIKYCLENLI